MTLCDHFQNEKDFILDTELYGADWISFKITSLHFVYGALLRYDFSWLHSLQLRLRLCEFYFIRASSYALQTDFDDIAILKPKLRLHTHSYTLGSAL